MSANTLKLFSAVLVAAALLGLNHLALAQEPPTGAAAALLAKRVELQSQLRANAFGAPLVLNSHEDGDRLEGDVYAEVEQPFAAVTATFKSAGKVCDVLFLHLNVHSCQPSSGAKGEGLTMSLGAKRALVSGMIYSITYAMRIEAAEAAYQRVTLSAAQGPLSTRDYRIVFEVVPIDAGRSFVHFGYGYSFGTMARLAMKVYLATAGRTKIGFTVVGKSEEGRPVYLRGELASLERNVIRNYLALIAYSSVTKGAPQEQMEARLRAWFALTERYAPQLHELDLDEYLHEKHDDLARAAAGGK